MNVIAGGRIEGALDAPAPAVASAAEQRVAEALLSCMGRWGLAKTTIEDVAREAGVSRATVYRLFPGGKQAILDAAAQAEVRALLAELGAALEQVDRLEDCLVQAIHHAACFLDQHDALSFMRTHEPVALEQVLAFDRLDVLFQTAGTLLQPVLVRFLAPEAARDAGVWLTRLVVSYLGTESARIDLCDERDVRTLVATFVLPGLSAHAGDPLINLTDHRPTDPTGS